MNKYALGTVLGSALLATLKRKGSSATDTKKVIVEREQRFYIDFMFTIHKVNLPVQLLVDEHGVQEELSDSSIILVENKIDEIENMLNTKLNFEKFWLSQPFVMIHGGPPNKPHIKVYYNGSFFMGDGTNESVYEIDEWNYKPKYDINGDIEENQELKRLRCDGTLSLHVVRAGNQEKIPDEYFENMLSTHVLKKLEKFIENETNLEITFDGSYGIDWGYEEYTDVYTIENGEKVLWEKWKVKDHDSSFLPKIRVK